ncbi:hypothetical protein CC86DRAFT_109412 [Ophiobolus disseminans]|uniref:Uncharacterized protein n=1 Tax=Ophiobolus disseminans TaxID=1469910 RepID=A0A6A6ZLJ9_9PLEO|nr:hypothetical protein CC86DRAFT_109412 [Ophiobolus disseminans]
MRQKGRIPRRVTFSAPKRRPDPVWACGTLSAAIRTSRSRLCQNSQRVITRNLVAILSSLQPGVPRRFAFQNWEKGCTMRRPLVPAKL